MSEHWLHRGDYMGVSLTMIATVSEKFSKLINKNEYEPLLLRLMNASQIIFPSQYEWVLFFGLGQSCERYKLSWVRILKYDSSNVVCLHIRNPIRLDGVSYMVLADKDSKRATAAGRKKHAGGMFFSPGKSPIAMQTQPNGCGCIAIFR